MVLRSFSCFCLLLSAVLLGSVFFNWWGDEVNDGRRERGTLVSRAIGVERYYRCEHIDTIHHGGSEWEWVWECEKTPILMPDNGTYEPLAAETIERSFWLRVASKLETWHEGVLGCLLAVLGFILLMRSYPPLPPKDSLSIP